MAANKAPKTIDGFYDWLCRECPQGTNVGFQADLGYQKEKGRVYSTVTYRLDLNTYGDGRPVEIQELLRKTCHSLEDAALWVTRQAIPLLKGAKLEVPRPKQPRLTSKPPRTLRIEHHPEPSPLIP